MPISMAQKKAMKAQLQAATKLRLQGLDQFKWQRRKVWQKFQLKWTEYVAKMELWSSALKKIEGNFGTGVVAYFLFLRWLMFLNLLIFALIFSFIVMPQVFLGGTEGGVTSDTALDCSTDSWMANSTECCAHQYLNDTQRDFFILDLVQGTGFMEKTLMFYGMYTNRIFGDEQPDSTLFYNLPLAYVCIGAAYLLLSLIAIVRAAAREFKDRLVEGEGQFYQYCNLIFGGWDFCIHNEKSAFIKHKALYNEIVGLLQAKRMEYERHNRSRDVMFKLTIIRLLVNLLVIIILAAAAVVIYILFDISMTFLYVNYTNDNPFASMSLNGSETISTTTTIATSTMRETMRLKSTETATTLEEQMEIFFYEFMPYIAIVCMNLLVPFTFNYLVQFERYSPLFVIKMTLLRTVFLRLASLAVLLSRFYILINPDQAAIAADSKCYNIDMGTPQCWETFVGQQFYKLFITDFVTHIFVTFFINFPRSLLAKHSDVPFLRLIGEQEFELSKHVLDIVYSQTLCWLGSFYAPFLPAIAVLLNFFMFYIKKFACLINSKPSAILYRASRSNSLFMFILLLSFVLAVIPVVYAVAEILPSRSCGPFRGLTSVWAAAITAFMNLPDLAQNVIFFFGTAGFAVPAFVVLTLFLYYYYAVSAANKHMVEVLKNQLVLEGHDKQFLLNRLSSFLKQHQDYQKKLRQTEQRQQQQLQYQQQQQRTSHRDEKESNE